MKNIILIAPPAAGKGTLAKDLQDAFGYVSLSTGDMLRKKAETDMELASMMKSGMLIDDKIVFSALKSCVLSLDKPYILDGFPRTLEQAKMYDELLLSLNKELGVVIYLDVPRDVLEKRVTSRRICPNCKRTYNTVNSMLMPKEYGICDDCGSSLITRGDDSLEAFNSRYGEYLEKTSALINYYESKNVLKKIVGLDSSKVFEDVSLLIK